MNWNGVRFAIRPAHRTIPNDRKCPRCGERWVQGKCGGLCLVCFRKDQPAHIQALRELADITRRIYIGTKNPSRIGRVSQQQALALMRCRDILTVYLAGHKDEGDVEDNGGR